LVFSSLYPKNGPDPWPDGAIPAHEASMWYRTGPFASPTNLVYIDRFLALAESRGIPVFFLVAPIHPGTLAQRERRGLDVPYCTWLRRVVDRHKNVTVVDGRHSGYDYRVFIDSFHLDAEGNAAQSDALAELIAARLDGQAAEERWVRLPWYTTPRAKLAIEELSETMASVSALRARR
jgi:hypothetical protein